MAHKSKKYSNNRWVVNGISFALQQSRGAELDGHLRGGQQGEQDPKRVEVSRTQKVLSLMMHIARKGYRIDIV